jgi:peptidyl-prolyl cis-trans isomerase C
MKSFLTSVVTLVMALPIFAQAQAPAQKPEQKPVAIINGEVITQEKLDFLYDRLGTQTRQQYEKVGGKKAFLDNYIGKRLIVQEALKSGFDKRSDVQADVAAAAEGVLFDRYVRDVLSGAFISEAELRKYYNENKGDFTIPEKAKIRHIVITAGQQGPKPKPREQALEIMSGIVSELRAQVGSTPNSRIALSRFAEAARKYSEDGSAPAGGDIGWHPRGVLEATFEEAAFALQPGVISGVIETPYGFHLIFVEERSPASVEPFEDAKPSIREYLMTKNAAQVLESVKLLQNELRASSKISVFPDNIQ